MNILLPSILLTLASSAAIAAPPASSPSANASSNAAKPAAALTTTAHPADIALSGCLTSATGEFAQIGCYRVATAMWESDMWKQLSATLQYVAKEQQAGFTQSYSAWFSKRDLQITALRELRDPAASGDPDAKKPSNKVALAIFEMNVTKARAVYLSNLASDFKPL